MTPSTKTHAGGAPASSLLRGYDTTLYPFGGKIRATLPLLSRSPRTRHIREYQAQLFTVQKLSPGSVTNHLCAPRFFYIQTLKKPWSIGDTPYPKKRHRLPIILSQEEVAQLIDTAHTPFHRTILMTLYAMPPVFGTRS